MPAEKSSLSKTKYEKNFIQENEGTPMVLAASNYQRMRTIPWKKGNFGDNSKKTIVENE